MNFGELKKVANWHLFRPTFQPGSLKNASMNAYKNIFPVFKYVKTVGPENLAASRALEFELCLKM